MSESINADELAKAIQKQLKEYTAEKIQATQEIAMNVSGKAVKKLRQVSRKKSGKYAKNWTRESGKYGITIYNKAPTYRLTHLLEKGHQLRRGGRKIGQSPAYPHIAKVEEECIEEYTRSLERELGE